VRLLLVPVVAATLVVSACGAGQETSPVGSTQGSEPEAPLPDVARVVCRAGEAPTIVTPAVKPRSDGVHVRFVNETGKDLSFSIEDPSEGGMGSGAPQGTSTQVVDLHPGTVSIACYDSYTQDGSEVAKTPLEIVDEDGLWVSTRLQCTSEFAFSQTVEYVAGARGKSDPLAAAEEALESYMQEGDVVEPAGYPDTRERIYRLLRAGKVLATVSLFRDGAGGWLSDTVDGCSELEE
jgi:hypothetical protein